MAASVPNNTLDEGPLATCTDSKSSGLMSLMRDGTWPPTPTDEDDEVFSIRTPSRTRTGSLESDTLFDPRIRIRVPVPLVPPLGSTVTPGVRASSRSLMLVGSASLVTAAASTLCAAVPASRAAWFPVAVTTIASRPITDCGSATSAWTLSPALVVTRRTVATYPMSRMRIDTAPVGTLPR